MFRIDMLKAAWGDALWIEYGRTNDPKRILIDGGTVSTYQFLEKRILDLPEDKRHFELFVITHVDGDHIEGAIKLLGRTDKLKVTFGDIWFNGYRELPVADDRLGGMYGEFLSALIEQKGMKLNKAFNPGSTTGNPIIVTETGDLPYVQIDGGLTATILSPTRTTLKKLVPAWIAEIEKYGLEADRSIDDILEFLEKRSALRPEDIVSDRMGTGTMDIKGWADSRFMEDDAEANGSSIAILFEFDDPEDGRNKKCLMTGDAFPSVLCASLRRLVPAERARLRLDALKLSHHGSKNNTSDELLQLIDCQKFLFSTNGQRFSHPNKETIARVLINQRRGNVSLIHFNYLSEFNEIWKVPHSTDGDFPYDVCYADDADDCLSISL